MNKSVHFNRLLCRCNGNVCAPKDWRLIITSYRARERVDPTSEAYHVGMLPLGPVHFGPSHSGMRAD